MATLYGIISGPTSSVTARVTPSGATPKDFTKQVGQNMWYYSMDVSSGQHDVTAKDVDTGKSDGPKNVTLEGDSVERLDFDVN